jgi:hypothetical protein
MHRHLYQSLNNISRNPFTKNIGGEKTFITINMTDSRVKWMETVQENYNKHK